MPARPLDRTTRILLGAAAAWAAILVIGALVLPAYSSSSSATIGADHSATTVIVVPPSTSSATLVEVNGFNVLAVIALPLVLVGLATMALRSRQTVVAWAMTACVIMAAVVGLLSVGLFLLPIAVLLAVACGRVTSARGHEGPPGPVWRPTHLS